MNISERLLHRRLDQRDGLCFSPAPTREKQRTVGRDVAPDRLAHGLRFLDQ
jgi:hypothetical protein